MVFQLMNIDSLEIYITHEGHSGSDLTKVSVQSKRVMGTGVQTKYIYKLVHCSNEDTSLLQCMSLLRCVSGNWHLQLGKYKYQ